jgi:hypothetical protein
MHHPLGRTIGTGLVVAIVLTACSWLDPIQPGAQGSEREQRQAHEALARWDAAASAGGQPAFVPVGELTGQIGDWERDVGDNNKLALMAGLIETEASLPPKAPGPKAIRWADGTTRTISALSATQALAEMKQTGSMECQGCVPLRVVAATLAAATILTSRGRAIAPAWEFTLAGTRVHLTRIAVAAGDRADVTPPPWDANNPPTGISIDSVTGSVEGRQLTVSFIGAPEKADQPCGADYTAAAIESTRAVVVIVIPHERPHPFGGGCRAVGAVRTATVTLAEPLSERVVLEVKEGRPVSAFVAP